MLDFLEISAQLGKKGETDIVLSFIVGKSKDLMIRGGDFYAVFNEDTGLWSTDEDDLIFLVDREQKRFAEEYLKKHPDADIKIHYLRNSSTSDFIASKSPISAIDTGSLPHAWSINSSASTPNK